MRSTNDLALIVRINEDIKSVVKLARGINLLALNAILLSRRAGSVALGFGVIADELRLFSKSLTQTMQTLMQMSYASVQTVSQYQRQSRMNKLMVKTEQNITQGGFHFTQRSGRHTELQLRQHLVDAYAALKKLLVDADDASRFGSVIARSLKIEATYGGSFNSMLTQIALEFGNYIDAIPMILIRLDHRLQGQK